MTGRIMQLKLQVPGGALGAVLKDFKGEEGSRYPVTIEVPESDLGDLITALVTNKVQIVAVEKTGKVDTTPGKAFSYAGGKRNKGISGKDLVMQVLNQEPKRVWHGSDISREFVKAGFAGGSWGPPIGELVKDGNVRALGRANYVLPGVSFQQSDLKIL